MFDWTKRHYITAVNAIYLEEKDGENGRPFKARFLQAGLVKYDFGVCLLKKETIDKFVNTFISCPVIIDHKDNITETDKTGVVNKVWFSPEDGWYWCSGVITDKKAIELIEKGYNVSCQYAITEYTDNIENKLHNANPYDKEILNGVFEHLAIVENPRYEDAFIAVNAYIPNKQLTKSEISLNEFKDVLYTTIAEEISRRLSSLKAKNEEKWITVKPNGEEHKGRHLLIKDGESVEDALHRKGWYSKRQAKAERGKKDNENLEEYKKSISKYLMKEIILLKSWKLSIKR